MLVGHGRRDEAVEQPQSLFSLAEFLAKEPGKPWNGKQQVPSSSLFKRALGLELTSAGRWSL